MGSIGLGEVLRDAPPNYHIFTRMHIAHFVFLTDIAIARGFQRECTLPRFARLARMLPIRSYEDSAAHHFRASLSDY